MNELNIFLKELQERPDVHSVSLFGSYARGDNQEDSDIDLLIICNETKREVLTRNDQVFEIVWVKEDDAITYYDANKDNAVRLWNDAKVLFDKNKSTERIQEHVSNIKSAGKTKPSKLSLDQTIFDLTDSLKSFERDLLKNELQVSYLLNIQVPKLLNVYFDINAIWTPAPKQLLPSLKTLNPGLFQLANRFYAVSGSNQEKVSLFREMIDNITQN